MAGASIPEYVVSWVGSGLSQVENLALLVKTETLSPSVVLLSLLGATVWGAAHALTPGHGKAIVASYLVGSRGTARHAAYLALTVTITHTSVVFLLGFLTLFAQSSIDPERLYPILGTISGLVICGLGASMFLSRVGPLLGAHGHGLGHVHLHDHHHDHGHFIGHSHEHGHDHGHSHLPPGADGATVTWRSLLWLGISGGLLPCPAALVLLLVCISLQRTALGLLLVLAFSFGLALVLMGIGLLFIKGAGLLDRLPRSAPLLRLLPAVSSLIITVLGVGLLLDALKGLGS